MTISRAFLAILVLASACGGNSTGMGPGPCDGSGADVVVNANDNNRFSPQNVTISAGQKVCWQNAGAVPHTVTSDDGPGSVDDGTTFDGSLDAGEMFVHTFAAAGSFPYHCRPHLADGMVGTVTVE